MFPFSRIVFPVDFSDGCKAAAPYVRDMTSHFDASLLLVHAFEIPVWLDLSQYPEPPHQRLLEVGRLQEFAAEHFSGLRTETQLVEGEASLALTRTIRTHRADLTMLPTHGRGLIRRFLIGSVTSKLLHDLDCPVWTGVHSALGSHQPKLPYQSIVCAVTLDEEAIPVMKSAEAFAKSYKAKLTLLNVVADLPLSMDVDLTPLRAQILDAADSRLRELRKQAGVEADVVVLDGSIPFRIRAEVGNLQADLVIAGRGHARNKLSRLGSSLYEIVRESPCPVLSF